jgi:hypothetical protein
MTAKYRLRMWKTEKFLPTNISETAKLFPMRILGYNLYVNFMLWRLVVTEQDVESSVGDFLQQTSPKFLKN